MESFNLPEGYQPVFVYYTGNGGEQYFTAPSMEEAVKLVLSEKGETEYNSAFLTAVITKAEGSYFFRRGWSWMLMELDVEVPFKSK